MYTPFVLQQESGVEERRKEAGGKKTEVGWTRVEFYTVFTLVQLLGIVDIVLVAVWTNKYKGGYGWADQPRLMFNWHFILMVVGFLYLFANSNLIFRFSRSLRVKDKLWVKIGHAAIHSAVCICVIVGTVAAFTSRNLKSAKPAHVYTLHSWIGIVTIALYGLMWLVGLAVYLWPGVKVQWRVQFLPYHVFLGTATFVCALVSVITGFATKPIFDDKGTYKNLPPEGMMLNFAGFISLVLGVLTLYLLTVKKFVRV